MSAELKQTVLDAVAGLPVPEVRLATAEVAAAAEIIAQVRSDKLASIGELLGNITGQLTVVNGTLDTVAAGLYTYAESLTVSSDSLLSPATATPDMTAAEDRHQQQVLRGFDTYRGLNEIQAVIKAEVGLDLRALMDGKVVGDMGSGHGALAKSAAAEGIAGEVYSINPRLETPANKKGEERAGRILLRKDYPELTDDELARIQAVHDGRLITAYADNLPVPDNFFDVMVDYVGVHSYMGTAPEDIYRRTLAEYARVLKPGGVVIVIDFSNANKTEWIGVDAAGLEMRKRVAAELGLAYRAIDSKTSTGTAPAIIWKR